MPQPASRCEVIRIGGNRCISSIIRTRFVFMQADGLFLVKNACQNDSDWILGNLLKKEEAIKEEMEKKKKKKGDIRKAYSGDARENLRILDSEIATLQRDLSAIRFDQCRYCGHLLGCKTKHGVNEICKTDEIEKGDKDLLIVASTNNTFRHAVHLHTFCSRHIKARLGEDVGLNLENKPIQTTIL